VSFKPVESCDEGCSIVGHDFGDGSPPAQDFLKEEGTEGASSSVQRARHSGHAVREQRA
jgi:hypothetical protein